MEYLFLAIINALMAIAVWALLIWIVWRIIRGFRNMIHRMEEQNEQRYSYHARNRAPQPDASHLYHEGYRAGYAEGQYYDDWTMDEDDWYIQQEATRHGH